MPGIPYGQNFYDGVRYIKVNRYDSGGLDRSDYLDQLQSITLTYPDRSAIEYPITTIQEQANYYLYGIPVGYDTSSKGNIEDYSFLATSASSFVYSFVPSGITNEHYNNRVSSYGAISGNSLGSMATSSGIYTSGQTPNKFIQVRISGSGVVSAGTIQLYAYIVKDGGAGLTNGTLQQVLINSSYAGGTFDTILYLTSSFNIIENDSIGFGLSRNAALNFFTCSAFHVSMSLYNAAPFNGSSSLVVFDPDAINFDYNDYNPLLGNAETPQFSTVWMDVDYSQNPLTPVNFGLIISGTADRAFVQDSNYSSKAWSNLRYNGSRTTSYRINQ